MIICYQVKSSAEISPIFWFKSNWKNVFVFFKPSCLPHKKGLSVAPNQASSSHTSFISYHNDRPPSSKCLPIPMLPQKTVPLNTWIPCSPKGFWWMNEETNFWKSTLPMTSPHLFGRILLWSILLWLKVFDKQNQSKPETGISYHIIN